MEKKMFCFQCEQTAGCSACTGAAGVCGKKADTAKLQDKLTGALIGLARSTEGNEDLVTPEINKLVIEALFATLTNVNFNDEELNRLIERVYEAKMHIMQKCSDIEIKKSLIFSIRHYLQLAWSGAWRPCCRLRWK